SRRGSRSVAAAGGATTRGKAPRSLTRHESLQDPIKEEYHEVARSTCRSRRRADPSPCCLGPESDRGPSARRDRPLVQPVQPTSPGRYEDTQEQVLTADYESCWGYLPAECWGRDASIKVVGGFAKSIPDMKFDVKEVLVAGD